MMIYEGQWSEKNMVFLKFKSLPKGFRMGNNSGEMFKKHLGILKTFLQLTDICRRQEKSTIFFETFVFNFFPFCAKIMPLGEFSSKFHRNRP